MKKTHLIVLSAVIALVCISLGARSFLLSRQKSQLSQQAGLSPSELMDRSIASKKAAASKAPKDATGYSDLGIFYLNHNKIDEAEAAFKSALNIDPKHGPSLENLGFVYYRKKDYANALLYLNKAREIIPDSSTLYNTLGAVYREKKMYKEALEAHRKAATLQKEAPDAYFNIALVYQEMRSPEEATAWKEYLSVASGIASEAKFVEIARQNLKKLGKTPPQ